MDAQPLKKREEQTSGKTSKASQLIPSHSSHLPFPNGCCTYLASQDRRGKGQGMHTLSTDGQLAKHHIT